jgi:hypothetical protein
MDKRSQPRLEKEMNVWLYRNNNLIAKAKTKNITQRGMYIKIDSLLFPKASTMSVVFSTDKQSSHHQRHAVVVHRNLYGIGVSFQPAA